MSVQITLRKADKFLKQNNLGGAAQLYLEVLTQFPNNPRAKSGLLALEQAARKSTAAPKPPQPTVAQRAQIPNPTGGMTPTSQQMKALQALMSEGKIQQLLQEGQRLAMLFPQAPELLNLLGLAHARLNQHEEAIRLFARATEVAPNYADAHINKAASLAQTGRLEETAEAAEKGIELAPNNAAAYLPYGYATNRLGAPDEAFTAFSKAIALVPDEPEPLVGAGNALGAMGRHDEAKDYFSKALEKRPNEPRYIQNFATALMSSNRADEAAIFLKAKLDSIPEEIELLVTLAKAQKNTRFVEDNIATCERILKINPAHAEIWRLLGSIYQGLGDTPQATECLKTALMHDPEAKGTLAQLWEMLPLPADHPDLDRLRGYFESDATPAAERVQVGFTLFQTYDRLGDCAMAFPYLMRANQIRREHEPYDIDRQESMFGKLKAQFAHPPAPLEGQVLKDIPAPHRPVFIVGMPRSGTSLSEQILASHSQVFGGGELPYLDRKLQSIGWKNSQPPEQLDRNGLIDIRKSYFEGLQRLEVDAPVITDKTPLNFRWVGHALLAIPEARVLFMRRDSRATCWSNYSKSFTGIANNFGNDMVDTAKMYRYHLDLMAFWAEIFPDRVTMVPYEKLTENQEEESRKLVAAAGLEWEEACLDFHKTERAVKTLSASQVKQKMYTGSSEAWRRYEAYLGPMLEQLEGLD